MKAKLFKILGSQPLLEAMGKELSAMGYNTTEFDTHYYGAIVHNMALKKSRENFTKEEYCELYNDIGLMDNPVIFNLPEQYNEALAFCKEQLNDKYWSVD